MIIQNNEQPLVLPDFFLIGAMRSGSTSLYNYLNEHRKIFMPQFKEPHFFSYLGEPYSPHPARIRRDPWNVLDYAALFGNAASDQRVGEASTSYIYLYKKTIQNIKLIYGDRATELKFIGILRNPVERAWSLYSLNYQDGKWCDRDFMTIARHYENPEYEYDFSNFLTSGKYYEQVKSYREAFPLVKIFLFEELRSNSERIVRACLDFLGIRDGEVPDTVGTVHNFTGIPKNNLLRPLYNAVYHQGIMKSVLRPLIPENVRTAMKAAVGRKIMKRHEMPENVRDYLKDIFKEDIEKLKTLFSDTAQQEVINTWLQ